MQATPRGLRLHIGLFVATCASTAFAGEPLLKVTSVVWSVRSPSRLFVPPPEPSAPEGRIETCDS